MKFLSKKEFLKEYPSHGCANSFDYDKSLSLPIVITSVYKDFFFEALMMNALKKFRFNLLPNAIIKRRV